MAARYFVNGGVDNNWSTLGNWSTTSGGGGGSAVPLATDDVHFDSNSPNCTVNASVRVAQTLDFTGYTNTITMNQSITVSGNVTLVAAMSISGSQPLIVNASSTLTSNGKTWPNSLTLSGAGNVYTLADDWTVSATLTCGTASQTISGNTIYVGGGLTVGGSPGNIVSGTTAIVLNGTGTWTAPGTLRNNLTFNTAGTITLSGGINYTNGTLTYVAGTINAGSSTLSTLNSNLNTNGMIWNNVTITASSGGNAVGLVSDLTVSGTFSMGVNSNTITINGSTLYITGHLTQNSSNSIITGTTNIILSGTGNWTSANGGNQLRNNLTINTSGTITLGSTALGYNTGILTYTAGTVVTTGSTLTIAASTTLDTNGITWNNVVMSGTITVALSSNLNLSGTFTKNGTNSTLTLNGSTLNVSGSAVIGGTSAGDIMTGTAAVVFNGTGSWSGLGTLKNNTTINTSGTLTVSGSVIYTTGTLTYTAGTVVTTSSTLITGSGVTTTLDTNGINWNNITVQTGSSTLTLNSLLTATGTLTLSVSTTFNGTAGFIAGTFTCSTAGLTHTFKSTITYTVTTAITMAGTSASKISFVSGTATSAAILTLRQGVTQDVGFVNATDIDSSLGLTLWTYKGTLLRTTNWGLITANTTVASTYLG